MMIPSMFRASVSMVSGEAYRASETRAVRGRDSPSQEVAERLVWRTAYRVSGYVFTEADGLIINPKRITKTFLRLSSKTHLRRTTPRRSPGSSAGQLPNPVGLCRMGCCGITAGLGLPQVS